ncbi:glycosyltransferase, family 1 [Poseidonibacter lekithochrous]|nr:glycosyltransferase, family 1 [Poseidonibacter lekithochrous]
MKKILFIYLDNLFPTNNGSRKNSLSVIEYLQKNGYSIDIFCIYNNKKNDSIINEYCDNLYEYKSPLSNLFLKFINKILNIFILNPLLKHSIFKYILSNKMKKILKSTDYDKIILNYVQWHSLIPKEYLPKTIIFTHDIYYYRYHSFAKSYWKNIIYNNIKKYEIGLLKEYYKILVVADYEKKELSKSIDSSKIEYIGAPQEVKNIDINKSKYTFGFIGANAWQNEEALIYYINNFINFLDDDLVIAGSISNNKNIIDLSSKYKNIKLLGFVDSLDVFYEECKFIIAPILSGSGIKIKVLEALSYGKVVLATEKSLEGINVVNKKEIINIDFMDKLDLKNYIKNITENEYEDISNNAKKFINENFSRDKLFSNILKEN